MNDEFENFKIHETALAYDSHFGDGANVGRNNYLFKVSLGRRSYTGQNTVIMNASVGSFTAISWNVSIGGGEHDYSRITQHSFLYDTRNADLRPAKSQIAYDRLANHTDVGHDVWIGANAVIRQGVSIGSGAVVGALSFVNRDIPPYEIWAGNPAKKIGQRFSDSQINALLEAEWWTFSDENIKAAYHHLSTQPTNFKLDMLLKHLDPLQNNE